MDKNIFRRSLAGLKAALKKTKTQPRGNETLPPDTEGEIFRLWSWVLPLLLGVTAGWFCMACLEVWLNGRGSAYPVAAPSLTVSSQADGSENMAGFLKANPFKVTPMTVLELSQTANDGPRPVEGSLAAAVLKGTSPGYMAWLEDQGRLRLVMLGDSFDVYTLEEVTYLDATFVRGDSRVVKEISYGAVSQAASPQPQNVPAADTVRQAGQVLPPNPGSGAPGTINRDLVNRLLENPFDELKKVRIRPAANDQGLQVQWINNDSILSQLGVQKDDIVRAVNGIAFRNAMDISNSLNSLIASDNFVVEVMRGGVPTTLQYVVR